MYMRAIAATIALALATMSAPSVVSAQDMPPPSGAGEPVVDINPSPDATVLASETAAQVTNWVTASRDNGELPFIVVDKVAAEVFVFDSQGQLLGATAALLGVTPGDDSAIGVGDRELSEISPEDRTTPAGRFVASIGVARGNHKVLWVDYATSISLHAVVTAKKKERRLERLNSPTADDNRITYGCINVPADFFAKIVRPAFDGTSGIVYIIPESKQLKDVFLTFQPQSQTSQLSEVAH